MPNIIIADKSYQLSELAAATANADTDIFYVVKLVEGEEVAYKITRAQLLGNAIVNLNETDGEVDYSMNQGQIFVLNITGNWTLNLPTDIKPGAYHIIVKQDATGSRNLTAVNKYFSISGNNISLTQGEASAIDVLTFVSDGTNIFLVETKQFQSIG